MNRNGSILQRVDGVDAVLRCLSSDGIGDAHLWIEPKVRLDCRAGTERDVETVSYILLGQAELCGSHAVDVEVKIGSIDHLMHMHIDRSGDGSHALAQAARNLVVGGIIALHLYVDGRRESEVENLCHHIGGLKKKSQI